MARYLTIRGEEVRLKVELDEGPTAAEIWGRMPFEASASRWGDEIYFQIPVSADLEDGAREMVEVGDVAYWPQGGRCASSWAPRRPASARSPEPRAPSRWSAGSPRGWKTPVASRRMRT